MRTDDKISLAWSSSILSATANLSKSTNNRASFSVRRDVNSSSPAMPLSPITLNCEFCSRLILDQKIVASEVYLPPRGTST